KFLTDPGYDTASGTAGQFSSNIEGDELHQLLDEAWEGGVTYVGEGTVGPVYQFDFGRTIGWSNANNPSSLTTRIEVVVNRALNRIWTAYPK
ncbi:MAG: hypothetical protein KF906_10240, partial [Actinobacteria bacterium]|nr:hypothetical protein [Actinomycetota bacterium]